MGPTEFAVPLTENERELRDRFVNEYLKDFDEIRAAIRTGFQESYAREYGPKFMREPYVLNRIEEWKVKKGITTEVDQERIEIIAMLKREAKRENHHGGTGSSRVSALVQLSKVLGIEAPTKVEVADTTKPPPMDHLPVEELEAMREKLYGKTAPALTHAAPATTQ